MKLKSLQPPLLIWLFLLLVILDFHAQDPIGHFLMKNSKQRYAFAIDQFKTNDVLIDANSFSLEKNMAHFDIENCRKLFFRTTQNIGKVFVAFTMKPVPFKVQDRYHFTV